MSRFERIFPLLGVLRGYRREDLRADFVAGITTAVMLVPQGMAYAMLAGLPPIYGVYAALIPAVFYALLGTSRQLSVGPVAMDSLLVAAGVGAIAELGSESYLAGAIVLALMVGLLQILMGLLRMGFLVNFLSVPVISGFTSAAAIIIGLSQAKYLLGVDLPGSSDLPALFTALLDKSESIQLETALLGASAIGLMATLKKLAPKVPAALLTVSLGSIIVMAGGLVGQVAIVGDVPAGLPTPRLPTIEWGQVKVLFPTALTIALVAFMESISVSQAYARKNKYRINADRELVALGVANAAGALFQGYPVAGGFSRTAVNAGAGARTNVAALITSVFVAASLLFLTPLFYYMPKAALAAIIVTAVGGLIDYNEAVHLNKVKRADLAMMVITFLATLSLGILTGIGVGVLASLVWFIVKTTRPHIAVLGRVPGTKLFRNVRRNKGLVTYEGVIAVRMDAQFYFGNVSFLRATLEELEAELEEPLRAIVLDFSAINNLDSSAESALSEMFSEYTSRGVAFYLASVKGPVRDVLESSGLEGQLGNRGRCLTVHDAMSLIDPAERGRKDRPSTSVAPPSAGVRASGASARL